MMLGRARKCRSGRGTGHGSRGLKAAARAARTAPWVDSEMIFRVAPGKNTRNTYRQDKVRARRQDLQRRLCGAETGRAREGPAIQVPGQCPGIIELDGQDRIRFVI